jgi:two-component system, OmpR family, response regulator MprA
VARILVVDDDPRIVSLVRRGLAFEGYEVDTAGSGSEGLLRAAESPPDLVVLDVMMPGIDGMEVCRRLRGAGVQVPILMLTARDAVTARVQGLDAGADDYMVKPFALEELLARVRALLRRGSAGAGTAPVSPVLRYLDLELDTATREARRNGKIFELTAKEYDLLQLFLQHPRQVLTRDFLMDRVWGYDFSGESNVLEVYIGYLRQKMGEPRLIQTVRGAGYVLKES